MCIDWETLPQLSIAELKTKLISVRETERGIHSAAFRKQVRKIGDKLEQLIFEKENSQLVVENYKMMRAFVENTHV